MESHRFNITLNPTKKTKKKKKKKSKPHRKNTFVSALNEIYWHVYGICRIC